MVKKINRGRKFIGSVRKCLHPKCDKVETYDGERWKEHWYNYQDSYLCATHRHLLFDAHIRAKYRKSHKERVKLNNEKFNKIHHPRRLRFKEKSVLLKENPRTGYCSLCRNNIFDESCKRTNLHHIEYHEDDPLKDTIELCFSCHVYLHWEQRNSK